MGGDASERPAAGEGGSSARLVPVSRLAGSDPFVDTRAFLCTNPADESMTFGLSIIWTKSAGDADYAFSVERSSKNSR